MKITDTEGWFQALQGIVEERIRKAQEEGTRAVEHAVFVKTAAFARPREQSPNMGHGHHWFGNAESYFLIGDALARGMIDLLEHAQTP